MKKYEHGGNVWNLARQLNVPAGEIVDLSTCTASEMPDQILPVLKDANLHTYLPEPYSAEFSKRYHEIHGGEALLVSGTTEAIAAVCAIYMGKKCAILIPTYSDYERYAFVNGCKVEFMTELKGCGADLYFICNPNNPTGKLYERDVILALAESAPDTLFVVDESYMPFVENAPESTLEFGGLKNIAVLRSFSKLFALPGLRIGYLAAAGPLLEKVKEHISPWSVGTGGQKSAVELLKLPQEPVGGLRLKEREAFFRELSSIPHLKSLPSSVHFALCALEGVTSHEMFDICAKEAILIRDCSNIKGLNDRYIRISMRKGWERLINVLKNVY